jgi:tRNA-Thr(GGU) m(6)t(6)A37 methyltransferase TsaA
MSKEIVCRPVGIIYSQHKEQEKTPIQPGFARGIPGRVEIFPEFEEGLEDIEAFTHLILLYHLHRAGEPQLKVTPFLDEKPRGVFATRHPRRPNRIGLSVVRLVGREGNILHLEDVDILDGTPLLDVKPYMPRFDAPPDAGGGWTDGIDPGEAWKRGRRKFDRDE